MLVAAPPIFPALAAELSPEQKLVASAWKKVDQEYVDRTFAGQDWFTVRQKLVKQNYASRDAAYDEIRGMLGKLGDKYTRFLTPAMYDAVFSVATGDVAGIGVELEALGGDPFAKGGGTGVAIATVVEGGPADKAGLKPGDVLQSVDGDDVGAKTPEEAAAGVRGAPGSRVRLAVRRDGADEVLVIERGAVKLAAVTTKVAKAAKGETVGVIRIRQFSTSTAADVKKALEELTPKVGRLVLDLRGNTGGYFPGGVDVARLLLPNDATITVVTDYKLNEVKYTTFDDGVELEKPVVALVDGRTASASEILTSALQDNARATVVGGDEKGSNVRQGGDPERRAARRRLGRRRHDRALPDAEAHRHQRPRHPGRRGEGVPAAHRRRGVHLRRDFESKFCSLDAAARAIWPRREPAARTRERRVAFLMREAPGRLRSIGCSGDVDAARSRRRQALPGCIGEGGEGGGVLDAGAHQTRHRRGGQRDMPLALDHARRTNDCCAFHAGRAARALHEHRRRRQADKHQQVQAGEFDGRRRRGRAGAGWVDKPAATSRCASSSCAPASRPLRLALALVSEPRWRRPAHVLAVDRDQTRMTKAVQHARSLGLDGSSSTTSSSVKYRLTAVEELGHIGAEYAAAVAGGVRRAGRARRAHAVLALHACDTATDDALAAALRAQANIVMVAPCCQAELAAKWARGERSEGAAAFAPIHTCGSLRRDMAATTTDAMRMALLRASGYSVSAADFVPPEHTPKNRLIVAKRLPPGQDTHEKRDTALREYERLAAATGGAGIKLAQLLL